MNTTSQLSPALRSVLEHPVRGVAGVVDDLLAECLVQGFLQLDWRDNACRVRCFGGDWEELAVPLRKSVFRAILARIAALCNERSPNSVSPYGGQGELSVGNDTRRMIKVAFTNTPEAQKLELLTGTD
jgi:hypothetical protein